MSVLELSDIWKGFSGRAVLKGISLKVRAGELLTVVGPSGAGKTTLLRIIAGLERQDRGSVIIDGSPVNGLEPYERGVAMVFQNPVLYPHLKVWENIALPITRGTERVPKEEAIERVRSVARLLRIEHILHRYPSRLSGGEKQRVMLAKALVRRPRVFLLDEPFANLDAPLRLELRMELLRIQRVLGVTTIFVTHDQVEALSLGDRVCVLMEGEVKQVARPEEVYGMPENSDVASFIGSPGMNLLRGAVTGGRVVVRGAELAEADVPDGEYLVGFRPEGAKIGGGQLRGRVAFVEYRGHEYIIYVDLGGEVVAVRSGRPFEFGERVSVGVREEHLFLFDTSTGKRVWP